MITINSTSIKNPKSFSVDISDLDGESYTNAAGELIRDRVAVKRKLDCVWGPLTQAEISVILTTVTDAFFTVSYPDPITGVTSGTFYVGDRTTPMYRNINGVILWEGLKMNFVQK